MKSFICILCFLLLVSVKSAVIPTINNSTLVPVFQKLNLVQFHPKDEWKELFLTSSVILYVADMPTVQQKDEVTLTPDIESHEGFAYAEVTKEFMEEYFGQDILTVCLKKGTPIDYATDYFEASSARIRSKEYSDWFSSSCARVELGLVSFIEESLELYWISPQGEEISIGTLEYGEPKTLWRVTYVGHRFVLKSKSESSSFRAWYFTVYSDNIYRIGEQKSILGGRSQPEQYEYDRAHAYEMKRAARILKIFTNTGYKRIQVPRRLWGSIRTFWNNNRYDNNMFSEIWEGKGIFVNWWVSEPKMAVAPFGLKRSWHDMFQPILEDWSKTKLESTDIYGIRIYYRDAELIDHVDRHETHAVSAIINVEQGGMQSDWELEIYDVHGKVIHSDLQRGEAMLYESAKCMHGRPKALQGDYYANVFFHYRPIGNPNWWKEPSNEQSSEKEL